MSGSVLYRLRILLLEANRYRSLLIDRELSRRYTTAILTRFADVGDALRELRTNTYDVAVIDLESVLDRTESFLVSIRETNPNIVLVGFGPTDMSAVQRHAVELWADSYLVSDDDVHTALAGVIDRFARRWERVTSDADSENILDARTRSAIISTTVRTLAHEINNPLMTILGTTELLLDRPGNVDPSIREKVRMIRESADRIQETLAELANLSGDVFRRSPVGPLLESRQNARHDDTTSQVDALEALNR